MDAQELRSILGNVNPRAAAKDRVDLHPLQAQWIEASPFCWVATADAQGNCDVSPKGDPAGFCKVLNSKTLLLPERPGNRRGDGFHNILENPRVGLCFLIPGRTESLRVNGQARILSDAPFFDSLAVEGHRPKLVVLVDIQQTFFHCSKAFLRSDLWQPETWKPESMPTRATISHSLQPSSKSLEELEKYYGASYADGLYKEP
jgi:PPOX class probable FMN-dependent enzyme